MPDKFKLNPDDFCALTDEQQDQLVAELVA